MIADGKSLAARWNARRKPSVDAEELLDQAPTPGVLHYARVHEENIDGDSPYAQIAIEYEIEMIPLRYGDLLVARCVEILGAEILSCPSFARQHIALDAAHTRFNARSIAKLVELSPSRVSALVSAGTAALDAYAQFIDDCVQLAKRDSRKARGSTDSRPLFSAMATAVASRRNDASREFTFTHLAHPRQIASWVRVVRHRQTAAIYRP